MGLLGDFDFSELRDLKKNLGDKLDAATHSIKDLIHHLKDLTEAVKENTRSRR